MAAWVASARALRMRASEETDETVPTASGIQETMSGRDGDASLEHRLLPPCLTAAHTRQRHGLGLHLTTPQIHNNFHKVSKLRSRVFEFRGFPNTVWTKSNEGKYAPAAHAGAHRADHFAA